MVIDIGATGVDVVTLKGSRLRIERLGQDSWKEIVQRLRSPGAERPAEVILLSQPRQAMPDFGIETEIRLRTAMANSAARWLADRHRLDRIISVEVGRGFATAAVVRSGAASQDSIMVNGTFAVDSIGALELVEKWIRGHCELSACELVIGGELGPVLAAGIAESVGAARAWLPDFAGCMAAIGAILSPVPITIELTAGDVTNEPTNLRALATDAMVALSDRLSQRGLDFDDVICEVQFAVGEDGAVRWLSADGAADVDVPNGAGVQGKTRSVRAVRAVAVVDTRQWEVLSNAEVVVAEESNEELHPPYFESMPVRDSLLPGECARGAVVIREPTHVTVVPEGWIARRERAGGTQLYRETSREAMVT